MPSSTTGTRSRDEDGDQAVPDSPSKVARLYPPHYAGIQSIEAHGDEEVGQDMIPEEVNEEMFAGYGGNEDDEPPIATEEHLQLLDEQAKQNEVERMLKMPAMEKASREEVERNAVATPSPQSSSSLGSADWRREDGFGERVWSRGSSSAV